LGVNDQAGYFYYIMELADDASLEAIRRADPTPATYQPKTLGASRAVWSSISGEMRGDSSRV
jgi:hypothetical protein